MSTLAPVKHKNTYEECVRAAIAPVSRRMDCWKWANQERLYMDREELLESMSARSRTHIIVDTRDDDAAGGHIYGAIHLPDGSFNEQSVLKILAQVRQLHASSTTPQTASNHASVGTTPKTILVIFHCM